MNQIVIRKATLKDLSTLLKFEQGVIEAERPLDPTLKRSATTYYNIEEMISAQHVYLAIAEYKAKIVGCGYVRIEKAKKSLQHNYFGYLGFMYTLPKYRGKGINRTLIEALVLWCTKKEIHEIRLHVYDRNEAAIKAYEKAGFNKHMIEMRIK